MQDQGSASSVLGSEHIQILLNLIKSTNGVLRKYAFLVVCLLTFYREGFSELLKLISSPVINSMVDFLWFCGIFGYFWDGLKS